MKIKTVILFLLSVSIATLSFSQNYIDLTKNRARVKLEKLKLQNKDLNIFIEEKDSTLAWKLRDSSVQNLDFILFFDDRGKCYKEINILTCDSCYQKLIKSVLSNKFCRWTKIDSSTYFARFPYRIILNTKVDKEFAFEIIRSNLAGEEYRRTVRKALNENL